MENVKGQNEYGWQ